MIIMKLQGGLGNQLFQYSLGRHLAIKHKTNLKLDTAWYGAIPDRKYELDNFNISGEIATPTEITLMRGSLLSKIKNVFRPINQRTVVTERFFTFDPDILRVGPDAIMEGYWQSEEYFKSIADTIRKELTLTAKPTGQNKQMLHQIDSSEAITLHIRRGDYVSDQAANQHHGTISLAYYYAAIKLMTKSVKKPHFFVFSDDSAWVQENLTLDCPTTYVTHNDPAHGYEDLRLMNHCKHFIIANSTFSWWGAWLSSYSEKIVIAPKRWFRHSAQSDHDLIPCDWIRL